MTLLLKVASALILYFVTKVIYLLYFHPLSRYPGPKTWILSRIPYLICMNTGQFPFRIKELHDIYGPVVRLSADELSFNDPQAWKDIYNRREMCRPPQWGFRPPGVDAHSLISAPAADHLRFRKALTPAFSEKSSRGYEPVVRAYIEKLLFKVGQASSSGPIDLFKWVNFTNFDIIGEITWSKSYGCVENATGHVIMDVLFHFRMYFITGSIKYYPWLDRLLTAITPKSAFKPLQDIFQGCHNRLRDRMQEGKPLHEDLVSYLQSYKAEATEAEQLSQAEIEQNILTVTAAGSDTITTAIGGAFHLLLAHPHALAQLAHETRTSFATETDINATSLAKMPYLNAVIDETLRLYPPVPDALRRKLPVAGAAISGRAIPAHTTVSVSCYNMFRSASHFKDPDHFIPERWIDSRDGSEAKDVFHPFSIGPRNCLGQTLARMQMRLIIAMMLWSYDIKIAEGECLGNWEDRGIYWTWVKQPLRVELRKVAA